MCRGRSIEAVEPLVINMTKQRGDSMAKTKWTISKGGATYRLEGMWESKRAAQSYASKLRAKGMKTLIRKGVDDGDVAYLVYAHYADFYPAGKRWVKRGDKWVHVNVYRDPQGRLFYKSGGRKTYVKPGRVRKKKPR